METFDDSCVHKYEPFMKTEQIEAEEFAPEQMPQGIKTWRCVDVM